MRKIVTLALTLVTLLSANAETFSVVGVNEKKTFHVKSGDEVTVGGTHHSVVIDGRGATITVGGANQAVTVNGPDADISVGGSGNVVHVNGSGASVTVQGSKNKVYLDASVREAAVGGAGNIITVSVPEGETRPEISTAGATNQVIYKHVP